MQQHLCLWFLAILDIVSGLPYELVIVGNLILEMVMKLVSGLGELTKWMLPVGWCRD